MVRNADDVARLGGVGELAVLREEQDRGVHGDGLAEARRVSFMPLLKVPETCRMKAMRSRWLGSMLA